MPPRFAYWTILAGGLPTAFRAADKDELMPTFRRLKERHPDAEMKYFARGKLWASAEEAKLALERERRAPDRRDRGAGSVRERRDRTWRPGGEHRDPRQGFADAKKARNRHQRQQRWQREHTPQGRPPRFKPHGDKFRDEVPRRAFRPAGHSRFEQQQEEPPRPRPSPRPDREPPPEREPKPEPPPRPSEPAIKPPGPPERGRRSDGRTRFRKRRREE